MVKPAIKSKAEELFAASVKKDKQVLKEREKATQERADQRAKLRALRMAKEAAEAQAAAEAAETKKASGRSPRAHRRAT